MPDGVRLRVRGDGDLSAGLQIVQSSRAARYAGKDNVLRRRVAEVVGPNTVQALFPERSEEIVRAKIARISEVAFRNQSDARRIFTGRQNIHRRGAQHAEKKNQCEPRGSTSFRANKIFHGLQSRWG